MWNYVLKFVRWKKGMRVNSKVVVDMNIVCIEQEDDWLGGL